RGKEAPGIVAVPVRLRSGMGRLFLLWAITITPGTIALLMEGELLYVHCLRRPEGGTIPGLTALEGVLFKLWG
ncbi:Na+/H+ antiporter subunit E, partial [bacterium]|nr:Na+/H+ antiporter subunit E [bacterium]